MNAEQKTKDFLSGYGLKSKKFDKKELGNKKTPDYRIYKGDELFSYCEVKNCCQ